MGYPPNVGGMQPDTKTKLRLRAEVRRLQAASFDLGFLAGKQVDTTKHTQWVVDQLALVLNLIGT